MYVSKIRLLLLCALIAVFLAGGIIYRDRFMPQMNGPDTSSQNKENLIRLSAPTPYDVAESPLIVEGEARGYWFFEATFPVTLIGEDGTIIAAHYAEAEPAGGGDWMTEDFVPFRAVIEFTPPQNKAGLLILEKANASGLPEHDDMLQIPIRFMPAKSPAAVAKPKPAACIKTGCSGQVCADHDVITTCEYKPEYACYENAVCERQADGHCGWTLTAAVGRCLQEVETGSSETENVSVTGNVRLGPVCPVAKDPPDPACADKPYQTTIDIFSEHNATFPIQSVETNAAGSFETVLPAGVYAFQPHGGRPFPLCERKEIEIAKNIAADILLLCDTGIR